MRPPRHNERGVAIVEFAIVLPLLLMLVLGTIEFGRAYNTQLSVTHAAREGVREYSVTKDAAKGVAAARAAATSLVSASKGVTTGACIPGQQATLTVTYPFTFSLPFLPASPIVISSKGVMRCGG
jgi:Flp pilus assembly protein TadG